MIRIACRTALVLGSDLGTASGRVTHTLVDAHELGQLAQDVQGKKFDKVLVGGDG